MREEEFLSTDKEVRRLPVDWPAMFEHTQQRRWKDKNLTQRSTLLSDGFELDDVVSHYKPFENIHSKVQFSRKKCAKQQLTE